MNDEIITVACHCGFMASILTSAHRTVSIRATLRETPDFTLTHKPSHFAHLCAAYLALRIELALCMIICILPVCLSTLVDARYPRRVLVVLLALCCEAPPHRCLWKGVVVAATALCDSCWRKTLTMLSNAAGKSHVCVHNISGEAHTSTY